MSPSCIAIPLHHEHLPQKPLRSSFVYDHGTRTESLSRPWQRCGDGARDDADSGGVSVPTSPWLRFEGPSAAILLGKTFNSSFMSLRISSKRFVNGRRRRASKTGTVPQSSCSTSKWTNRKNDWLYLLSAYQIGPTSNGYYRFSSSRKMDMLKV